MSNKTDSNSYNNVGLGTCKREGSKTKLQERMTQFLQDEEHKFHEAAAKLQMKYSFEVYACFLYRGCSITILAIQNLSLKRK